MLFFKYLISETNGTKYHNPSSTLLEWEKKSLRTIPFLFFCQSFQINSSPVLLLFFYSRFCFFSPFIMFNYLHQKANLQNLFPTPWTLIIFISYMGLFINQGNRNWCLTLINITGEFSLGLLVTASKTATHSYNYNTIVVVLLTEFVKLVVSLYLYRRKWVWEHIRLFASLSFSHSFSQLRRDIIEHQTG